MGAAIDLAHQASDELHLPPPRLVARDRARERDRVGQALGQLERREPGASSSSTSRSPSDCSAVMSRLRWLFEGGAAGGGAPRLLGAGHRRQDAPGVHRRRLL